MRKIYIILFFLILADNLEAQSPCTNADFESGDFTGWTRISKYSVANMDDHIAITSQSTVPLKDPYGNISAVAPGGNYSVRLGNFVSDGEDLSLKQTFLVSTTNPIYTYRYAIAYNNRYLRSANEPYFKVEFRDQYDFQLNELSLQLTDVKPTSGGKFESVISFLQWQSVTVDLSAYKGKQLTVTYATLEIETFDGPYAPDYVYIGDEVRAYVDGSCFGPTPVQKCIGEFISFSSVGGIFPEGATYLWDFGDNSTSIEVNPVHSYGIAKGYNASVKVTPPGQNPVSTNFYQTYNIIDCSPKTDCQKCLPRFSPLPGEKYLLSAWAKQGTVDTGTYNKVGIYIRFGGAEIQTKTFRPSGAIVEGWQRIEETFTVPLTAKDITINLINEAVSDDVFFDDIRVHPFNSNLKSFVYDAQTLKLVATLDENNYADIYEYDEQGSLIRIKRETEKGVMTVKESREFKAASGK